MSMNEGEVEETDVSVHEQINPTVREIFDRIFVEPMRQFNDGLEFIRENKFGVVWREENERNEKVMFFSKEFLQALATSFPSIHAEASRHIEGSTCDLFLNYVREKLANSPLGQDPFEDCCNDIKDRITRRILRIKEALETKHNEQPKTKSDLELMIRQTDLFDSIHIHHALLCCRIAYDCKDPEHSKRTLDELGKDHLLSELAVSYENESVPKYVIARCGDVLYVSFKAIKSHSFGRTEVSHLGEICSGLVDTANKIPLQYFVREIMQDKRIVFSGHSSGGAIASLVFLFLLEKFKLQEKKFLQSHFKCITFGLMPMANNMFKEYVEAIPGARDCFCHIVLKNDIIPRLFGLFYQTHLQDRLWELLESVLKSTPELNERPTNSASHMSVQLRYIIEKGEVILSALFGGFINLERLDTFGKYYILDSSKRVNKFSRYPSNEAAYFLRINANDGLRDMQSQYLVNHKIERYAHEVELIFYGDLPESKKYKDSCNIANLDDISPQITDVRFENIGEEVVAKISGRSMWFAYNVSIDGVKGGEDDLQLDLLKSTESEVQTRVQEAYLSLPDQVSVRVKTHFENIKHIPPTKVPAKTTKYMVSRRQQQLAKHTPRAVIELAYLSALLERRPEGHYSRRFNAITTFFESAVSVVPVESLFHAMATGAPEVVLQCCEILLSSDTLSTSQPSDFLLAAMELALTRLNQGLTDSVQEEFELAIKYYKTSLSRLQRRYEKEFPTIQHLGSVASEQEYNIFSRHEKTEKLLAEKTRERDVLLNDTASRISAMLKTYKKKGKRQRQHSLCNIDLEVIYPSDNTQDTRESKAKSCKAPITLLTEGRKTLNRISEEIIAEHSEFSKESTSAKRNSLMLKVLNDLRQEFQTCSTLLGAFMEARVRIPLEKANGDSYVNKIAKHASSFGLSVWALLILPFTYMNQRISNVSGELGQFVVEFSRGIRRAYEKMFPPSGHQFPDYDEKLQFLVGSMKRSWASNQNYISYSLERQLQDQCTKRNIFYHTPVTEILEEWRANFGDETLTLVPNEYRPLVARWIKWSLMINNLRESLASQTAVGVIGLVNSGKSKFVRSMFGKQAITGTTDQKRTTVPLIYNLDPEIKGMDVIDFPGVDDCDESIPELAKLLLSLARIAVFVVDYRRAHTESTREWLNNLARENVPVLICLTFADKLYAELMGENDDYDVEKVKSGIESQLITIKEQIGQPESSHYRDFKLTVFAFDNDSKLNTDEGKEKLRNAGLSDELDVGRWIAEKLQDYEQNDISQNVLTFIREKEKSTLNSNRLAVVPPATGQIGDVSGNREGSAHIEETAVKKIEDDKRTFLEKHFLDAHYNIKEEVHKKFQRFSWLHGAYGVIGPNKKISHPHLYVTVESGKKKSDVMQEIEEAFNCEAKNYFELRREPETKPKFSYLCGPRPSPGGGIVAVSKIDTKNPLRAPDEIEGLEESDRTKASGTLTMFCSLNGNHYALTCFHVGCVSDRDRFAEAFNDKELWQIQNSIKGYERYAKEQNEYYYHERKSDHLDENEDLGPHNYTRLGELTKSKFNCNTDIMSINVPQDAEIDCKVEVDYPDWQKVEKELFKRVVCGSEDQVKVEKLGYSSNITNGHIVECNLSYKYKGNLLFKDAIAVRGQSNSKVFLKSGDSGALIFFLGENDRRQAFAYGVCEVDEIFQYDEITFDEDSGDDGNPNTSNGGSRESNLTSSPVEEISVNTQATTTGMGTTASSVCETKNGNGSDSDDNFIVFGHENGPFYICLKLHTALENLKLLRAGCFRVCGDRSNAHAEH